MPNSGLKNRRVYSASIKRVLMLFVLTFAAVHLWAQTPTQKFAAAIAKAEGYYTKGKIPQRCANPGDLKAVRGWKYPGQIGICKGGHVRFKNATYGWLALCAQLDKIAARESKAYTPEMTLAQAGRKYAGDWRTWSKNVAHNLGVTPSTPLFLVLDVPPALAVQADRHALDFLGN